MRILILVLALMLASSTASAQASANLDGNEMLRYCKLRIESQDKNKTLSKQNETRALVCEALISGVAGTMMAHMLRGMVHPDLQFCPPFDVRDPLAQERIVVKFMENNPLYLHMPAVTLVITALIEAFPCDKKSATPESEPISATPVEKLKQALLSGNIKIMDLALKKGADLDMRLPGGGTLLTRALYARGPLLRELTGQNPVTTDRREFITKTIDHELEIAKWLIEKGADVNLTGYESRTALSISLGYLDQEAADLLIRSGADVNTKDERGMSALIHASYLGWIDIVRELIARDVDVNAENESTGWTALTYASKRSHATTVSIIKELIEAGVNVNVAGWTGAETMLLDSVQSEGRGKLVDLLKEAGATE